MNRKLTLNTEHCGAEKQREFSAARSFKCLTTGLKHLEQFDQKVACWDMKRDHGIARKQI